MIQKNGRLRNGLLLGGTLAIVAPLFGVVAAAAMAHAGYTVTANLTPSVPVGLYVADHHIGAITRGEIVSFGPHNAAARYGFQRGWIKPGGAYIKRVGAIAGDLVCVDNALSIARNSAGSLGTLERIGPVAKVDRNGRPLPHELAGCRRVPVGYFLPVGDGLPNSYDGRYYGFVPVLAVQTTLSPMWTDAAAEN
jgi:conjugative transfer signal peptidase TraF